jgi:bacteriocin-like protein
MKKFEKLSKAELKNIKGGRSLSCETIGTPCVENIACCTFNCKYTGTGPTGRVCYYPL